MSAVQYRVAHAFELGAVCDVLEAACRQELGKDLCAADPEHYQSAVLTGDAVLLTAEVSGSVVGAGLYELTKKHPQSGKAEAFQTWLYVLPEYRTLGVGGNLLLHCQAHLESLGIQRIRGAVPAKNPRLARTLMDLGYVPEELIMIKDL